MRSVQQSGTESYSDVAYKTQPGVRFFRPGNRELAQKPHKPHAAFWHCAKPHAEIRPEATKKPRREKCAKSEWSRSDGWTNCFPSSRIDQIVIWMNAIQCHRDLRV
ncbi:hypothetical protein DFH09DRAFT_1077037 [Mycena vulgaris]|nr:hypothetical protein DFH09DRAFT_1077037 [Mycena vulgaris]